MIMLFFVNGCTLKQKPIKRGEPCAHCRMPISDLKFANEVITKKGKIYFFDDIICASNMIKKGDIDSNNIQDIFVSNFYAQDELLNIKTATFLKCENLKSPMNGNIAAFKTKEDMNKAAKEYSCEMITIDKIF